VSRVTFHDTPFGPIMAAAAETTIVQVDEVVPTGSLDPESVVTPCIYVDHVVRVDRDPASLIGAFK
jgi:3-oxoadipate CoA-transferase alpha subunit